LGSALHDIFQSPLNFPTGFGHSNERSHNTPSRFSKKPARPTFAFQFNSSNPKLSIRLTQCFFWPVQSSLRSRAYLHGEWISSLSLFVQFLASSSCCLVRQLRGSFSGHNDSPLCTGRPPNARQISDSRRSTFSTEPASLRGEHRGSSCLWCGVVAILSSSTFQLFPS
jgi:hypothetical protein